MLLQHDSEAEDVEKSLKSGCDATLEDFSSKPGVELEFNGQNVPDDDPYETGEAEEEDSQPNFGAEYKSMRLLGSLCQ